MMVKVIGITLLTLLVLCSAFQLPPHASSRLQARVPVSVATAPWRALSAVESDTNLEANSCRSVVEECYSHWNRGDMKQAAACFAKEFTYDDGQFLGSIQNDKSQLEARFELGKSLLPPNSVLVVDSLAVCPSTGKIGTQWHVEDENQRTLPRTRGCSFYTVDASSGLLRTGFRVSEMLVKPSKDMANGLVSSASKLLESSSPSPPTLETPRSSPPASVIEAYFRAWNARDMDAALDCFVDDCVYETEDPVFVDKFEGKESLRKHLETNAKALPPACQIVLDDLAIDPLRETAGVKWHLEAGGVPIPNLRGCSMYTMDSNNNNNNSTGLLQSGFDVTEAPVKLPGVVGQTLLASTRVLPQTLFRTFWGVQ